MSYFPADAFVGVYLSGNVSAALQPSGNTSLILALGAGVSLSAAIPPGPYFVEPFSGQIFEGESFRGLYQKWSCDQLTDSFRRSVVVVQ